MPFSILKVKDWGEKKRDLCACKSLSLTHVTLYMSPYASVKSISHSGKWRKGSQIYPGRNSSAQSWVFTCMLLWESADPAKSHIEGSLRQPSLSHTHDHKRNSASAKIRVDNLCPHPFHQASPSSAGCLMQLFCHHPGPFVQQQYQCFLGMNCSSPLLSQWDWVYHTRALGPESGDAVFVQWPHRLPACTSSGDA